jgi:hypothetical protein
MKFSRIIGLACFAISIKAAAQETALIATSEQIGGKTQLELSVRWWQWAASFEQNESPVADRTGALCANGQSGDVWFLAGTYGTKRTVRTCRVPFGKTLFFPLINYVVMPSESGSTNCASVTKDADRITGNPSLLVLDLNGQKFSNLQAHRLATRRCFDVGALTKEKQRIFPSAGNGYYAAIRPLPKGTHTLEFGGVLPSMIQAVSYTLIVE